MQATITINFVVDVNAFIDALNGKPIPKTAADLYTTMPLMAEIAATTGAHLVDSDHILDLLETKLVTLLGYTEDEAADFTDLVQEVSAATQGTYVSLEDGQEAATEIVSTINSRFLGNGRGQIDHEDQQVLGAAHLAKKCDEDANAKVVIVTRDGGIHNIGTNVARKDIVVANTDKSLVVLAAMRRHR